VRLALLFFIAPIAVILLGGGLLIYLFQGQEISSENIDTRVHEALQSVLGDAYDISIGSTGLSFVSSSLVSLRGADIEVSNRGEVEPFLVVDQVDVGLDPLSLFSGAPKFTKLIARGGKLVAGRINADPANPPALNLKQRLHQLAGMLVNAEESMGEGAITRLQLDDFTIETNSLGRIRAMPITIQKAVVQPETGNRISMTGNGTTGLSDFIINASWSGNGQGPRQLSLGLGPISSLEWFPAVSSDDPQNAMGLESALRVDARIPFDADLQPLSSVLKVQAAQGKLQLAPNSSMALGYGILNLEIDPETRSAIIADSNLDVEGEQIAFNGSIISVDPINAGDGLKTEIKAVLADNPLEASAPLGLSASITGLIKPALSTVILDMVRFDTAEGSLNGSVTAKFGQTSPAVSADFSSQDLSVRALQRIWPAPLAGFARQWVVANLHGGRLADFKLHADIPEGRILDVNEGLGFKKGELAIASKFSGVEVTTFGEMPPVREANGNIKVDHAALDVDISSGFVPTPGAGMVSNNAKNGAKLSKAMIDIPNLFAWEAKLDTTFNLASSLQDMALIANAAPLNIPEKLAVDPKGLSGAINIGMAADFPIYSEEIDKELVWSADIQLDEATSKTKFFNHAFEKANMIFEIDQKKVSGKGSAIIDGQKSDVDFVEPILNGPATLRERRISSSLDHNRLAELGFSVDPVIKGPIKVEIVSSDGKPDRYTIDLAQAEVNLPWIYWSKGVKIPAKAAFSLTQKDGVNTLSGFEFSGAAAGGRKFGAVGQMSFDKNGLLSADLKNITLNESDLFDVKVRVASGRYNIEVGGKAFDARAIIQQLVHTGQFVSDKSETSVTLSANIGRLNGFHDQAMENAIVSYQTDDGRLRSLEIKGSANGRLATVNAAHTGENTRFDFFSDDAGSSLAFVNLYEKMRKGKLVSSLVRVGNGPFTGRVTINKFTVENEERLASIVRAPVSERRLQKVSGQLQEIDIRSVKFDDMSADIRKGDGSFSVENGRIRNSQIGLTFEGLLYDAKNQMNMRGTFMPLFSISRLLGGIPIIGDILSNGKNSGLIGITYRLKGAANNPAIAVNPISVIAPGIFREIFQFQE